MKSVRVLQLTLFVPSAAWHCVIAPWMQRLHDVMVLSVGVYRYVKCIHITRYCAYSPADAYSYKQYLHHSSFSVHIGSYSARFSSLRLLFIHPLQHVCLQRRVHRHHTLVRRVHDHCVISTLQISPLWWSKNVSNNNIVTRLPQLLQYVLFIYHSTVWRAYAQYEWSHFSWPTCD